MSQDKIKQGIICKSKVVLLLLKSNKTGGSQALTSYRTEIKLQSYHLLVCNPE